jgi:tetratricopeptide (TPR) repeat protein
MRKRRCSLGCVAVVALGLSSLSIGADDDWLEVQSEHFVITTNGKEKTARRLAKELETIRQIFRMALRGITEGGPPLQVLAAKNEKTLRALVQQFKTAGRFLPAGVFFRTPDKNWMVVNLDTRGDNPYAVAYHEYFHSLALPAWPRAPLWFHEGLAGVWENTVIHKKRVDAARPSMIYLQTLKNTKMMSLRDLLLVDQLSLEYREAHRATIFYAQSWALVHYIFLGAGLADAMGPYVRAINKGAEPIGAFEKAFGDIDDIEEKLRHYIRKFQFNILRIDKPAEADAASFSSFTLTKRQYHARVGSYFASIMQLDEAMEHSERALALDSDDSLAHETMGIVHFRRHEYQQAGGSFERSAALNAARHLPRFYLAIIESSTATTPEGIDRIRDNFERSVRANPYHAPSLSRLALIYGINREQAEAALWMGRRAAALLPDDAMSLASLGVAERLNGNNEAAVRAFERALDIDPEMEIARRLLTELQNEKPDS